MAAGGMECFFKVIEALRTQANAAMDVHAKELLPFDLRNMRS